MNRISHWIRKVGISFQALPGSRGGQTEYSQVSSLPFQTHLIAKPETEWVSLLTVYIIFRPSPLGNRSV